MFESDLLEEDDAGQLRAGRRLWRDFRSSKKAILGGTVIVVLIVVSILAPELAPHPPNVSDFEAANAAPSWHHLFGGDEIGRDVFSRTLYGTRTSVGLAALVVAISATFGTLMGAAAGFVGGAVDTIIMRTTDFMLVFPWLLLAILVITIVGTGFFSVVLALCLLYWLSYARVIRAETLKLRDLDFVQASRTLGSSKARILLRHIIPNVVHIVVVLATLDLGTVIIAQAALAYLGLGVQPPTPTWGGMIAEGQSYLSQSPWITLGPGAVLVVAVIGINLFGDWLRDAYDPSLQVV